MWKCCVQEDGATAYRMADPKLTFSHQFDVKEELGKGAFSVVKRVLLKKTGGEFAAKIINTRRLTSRDLQKLEREARICRMLKHHNIVQLHNVFQEDHVRYMIFDLVTGGELFDEIVAREFYSEKDASHCIQQILESVDLCHSLGIIHRDIKPENLLLASKAHGANVKLADFGLAVEAMDGKHYYGFAGTPGYLSPEVLRKSPYDAAVDVWAVGVVLYILLVGYPPFWDDDQSKMFEQIKKGKYEYPSPEWDTVTPAAKELINAMLHLDSDKRITAKRVLEHPWIKNREGVASTMHRQETLSGLKRFNARRKLKAAVHTAMLVTRKSSLFGLVKKGDKEKSVPAAGLHDVEEDTETVGNQTPEQKEIIDLTWKLLTFIAEKDWREYSKLCSIEMTCFEPESCGQLVSGLDFHKFYFDNSPSGCSIQQSMVSPKVHMLGENAACVAYLRMLQVATKEGCAPRSEAVPETRVWQKFDDEWKCVHFHRSTGGSSKSW